jgi:hypothetical protein
MVSKVGVLSLESVEGDSEREGWTR